MGKNTCLVLLAVATLIYIGPIPARGQAIAGAQIHGVVTDPSGGLIPNAQIKVTRATTGATRTTVSSADGTYGLPNLPVGPYTLDVEVAGFQHYVQSGIVLQVGENVAVDVSLKVGAVSQQVEVHANAGMVQTRDTSMSQVVDQERIVELPLNGRVATQLLILSGAALNSPVTGDFIGSKTYSGTTVYSVAGGQSTGINYVLDGTDYNDNFTNVNLPFPFPEALQEFTVETHGLSARYGVRPGAAVNAVTKSGSNQFHGDLFEFVRNGNFNARNFFAAKQDTLRRNQFGGTVGGPIKRDKLFFFFGYQGTRTRTTPPNTISYLPTQAVLAGDFSTLESAKCQSSGKARTIINPETGQPFLNGFVDPSLFNQQALNVLKYIPVSSDPCGQLIYGIPAKDDENQFLGRGDWTLSSKHTFFGRYFITNFTRPPVFDGKNLLTTTQPGNLQRAQSFALGDTYSVSSTIVNSAHAAWTRLRNYRGAAQNMLNPGTVGIPIPYSVPNFLYIVVRDHFGVGCGTCGPGYWNRNTVQLADDLDVVRGRHSMSFGVDWIHKQLNMNQVVDSNGDFYSNGQFTNDALLDFMLGRLNEFVESGDITGYFRQDYWGAYAQDDIHVNRRLNFNIGLRWEPFLPETETQGRGASFSPAAFAAGTRSVKYTNSPPGLLFVGDPGIPRGYTYNSLAGFEPRVGLALNPTGSGKQSIRASYGIYREQPIIFYESGFEKNAPWADIIHLNSPVGGLANPYQGYPGGAPFPIALPPRKDSFFPTAGAYSYLPLDDMQPTYVREWSLSYQVEIRPDWLLSASYLGNNSIHVWGTTETNPAVYIPGTCNGGPCSTTANTDQRRVLYLQNPVAGAMYSYVTEASPNGFAYYSGLVLSAKHRMSHGFTIVSNYTYSHCLSDVDFVGDIGPNYMTSQNPQNLRGEYGNCGFDLRHNFTTSFVANTPSFAHPWAKKLLGNWQLSGIVSAHSGTWFSPSTGKDNSLTGVGLDRPNAVGNPYVRNYNTRQWIDPTAFVPNALGTFGNAGRNSLLGPGSFTLDTQISRYFNIRENQRLGLRFEFFNVTNHTNFMKPQSTLSSSAFGRILGAYDPRIVQLALKYYF
ncbi:MAG: TonB-dependent receptor [Acidobacteriia bacterium]|nr:TonB-dependent receptor [Terriglobia bacterium]